LRSRVEASVVWATKGFPIDNDDPADGAERVLRTAKLTVIFIRRQAQLKRSLTCSVWLMRKRDFYVERAIRIRRSLDGLDDPLARIMLAAVADALEEAAAECFQPAAQKPSPDR
jgi:hypothetical protein